MHPELGQNPVHLLPDRSQGLLQLLAGHPVLLQVLNPHDHGRRLHRGWDVGHFDGGSGGSWSLARGAKLGSGGEGVVGTAIAGAVVGDDGASRDGVSGLPASGEFGSHFVTSSQVTWSPWSTRG